MERKAQAKLARARTPPSHAKSASRVPNRSQIGEKCRLEPFRKSTGPVERVEDMLRNSTSSFQRVKARALNRRLGLGEGTFTFFAWARGQIRRANWASKSGEPKLGEPRQRTGGSQAVLHALSSETNTRGRFGWADCRCGGGLVACGLARRAMPDVPS